MCSQWKDSLKSTGRWHGQCNQGSEDMNFGMSICFLLFENNSRFECFQNSRLQQWFSEPRAVQMSLPSIHTTTQCHQKLKIMQVPILLKIISFQLPGRHINQNYQTLEGCVLGNFPPSEGQTSHNLILMFSIREKILYYLLMVHLSNYSKLPTPHIFGQWIKTSISVKKLATRWEESNNVTAFVNNFLSKPT